MIIDEVTYLEHFGVKGMKWGTRKAAYKAHRARKNRMGKLTGRQRVGVIAGGYGAGTLASLAIIMRTKNLQLGQLASIPASIAGGLYIRKQMLKKHGQVKLSDIPKEKNRDEETRRKVEEFIKKNASGGPKLAPGLKTSIKVGNNIGNRINKARS